MTITLRRPLATAWTSLTAAALVTSAAIIGAPPSHASGYADCMSATGSLSYDGTTYSVRINDRCGPISSRDEAFGKRVDYDFSMGYSAYCASESGTLPVGSLGTSFRVSTSCLRPGSYQPRVNFSSFADSSYNTQYLSTIYIREPEPEPTYSRPTPKPTPTPTPTRTPAPVSTPRPVESPSLTAPGGFDSSALQVRVRKTLRGSDVLSSTISPAGDMRALVDTRLSRGDTAIVEVSNKDPLTGRYGTESKEVTVGKGGRVRVRADVGRYSYIYLRNANEKLLVRWTTQ